MPAQCVGAASSWNTGKHLRAARQRRRWRERPSRRRHARHPASGACTLYPPGIETCRHQLSLVPEGRVHIPVITREEVRSLDGESVHMAAGEGGCSITGGCTSCESNPRRAHSPGRGHGRQCSVLAVGWLNGRRVGVPSLHVAYDPTKSLICSSSAIDAANPQWNRFLVGNLRGELLPPIECDEPRLRLTCYHELLDAFVRDWRQFYLLHGEDPAGRAEFERLRDAVRVASKKLSDRIALRTNRVAAHEVLEGRVLSVCLYPTPSVSG